MYNVQMTDNFLQQQGLTVSLEAKAKIGHPSESRQLVPLKFTALVMPSSQPSILQLYRADNLTEPLQVNADPEDFTFEICGEAGTQVILVS